MSQVAKKDGASYWLRVVLWIGLSLFGWFVPAVDPITPFGMRVASIFIGMMFGWICLDLIYPSFFAIVLLALASGKTAQTFFLGGFGSEIVVMIIILTTFCAFFNKVGLDNVIAQWFIRLNIIQGRPWLFIAAFLMLMYVLGFMINIYATIFLLWPVMYKICDEAGFERGGKFSSYMCFAVTFISGLGMVSKPFEPWSLVGLNALTQFMGEGFSMNYVRYTIYMLIISALIMACYLLIGKFLKIDVSPLKNYRAKKQHIQLTHEQKIAIGFFVVFLVAMYLPSLLPEDWMLSKILNILGVMGIGALLLVGLGVARSKGMKLAEVDRLVTDGVPWKITFLMVGNAVIGSALSSEQAGIIAWINSIFGPMVQGLSPIMFYVVLILIYGITTQFVHNLVLLTIFTPVALNFGTMVGANPVTITFIGLVILSAALDTAGASSRSGLVFGNSEWIAPKWAYTLGIGSVVLVMIAYALIGVPLANIMFPM